MAPPFEAGFGLATRRAAIAGLAASAAAVPVLAATGAALAQDVRVAKSKASERAVPTSNLGNDERVDFYTTGGQLLTGGGSGPTWSLPIHGRVYKLERSTVRKAAIAKALSVAYGIEPMREEQMLFDERIDLLLVDNKGGRRVVVTIAGKDYVAGTSADDGHFSGTLTIPEADLGAAAKSGRVEIQAKLEARDPRVFKGIVLLIGPTGHSIISDIDDTVKVTEVTNRRRMMAATFLRPFEAVPGVSRLYQTWATSGASFHFVSSSPWHFYEPLTTFLTEAGFPPATVTLKQIRLKDSSIQNIFADATETKPPEIEKLLMAWPERKFVLVGDSGEKDPEIYADVLRRHPGRIEHVFIRAVTRARTEDERFQKAFAGLDAKRWQLFADASELPRTLG